MNIKEKLLLSLVKVKDTFLKYPLSIIALTVATVLFIMTQLKDYEGQNSPENYTLILMILASEAVFAFTAMLNIFNQKKNINKLMYIFLNCLVILTYGIVLLIGYPDIASYELLQGRMTGNILRIQIIVALSLVTIFIVPFLFDKNVNKWWNFSFTFVQSSLIATLYALVIFLGISLALGSLDVFWKFSFHDNQYAILAFISFFYVTQIYVLSKVEKLDVEEAKEIPSFIQNLVKFVVIPLIIVYTAIIYPYIFSFPFREEWPANQATLLIMSILALLYGVSVILYGTKEDSSEKKLFSKFVYIFNIISIPAIIFWAYSLYLRIAESGITVNRVALASIILVFFGLAIFNLIKKSIDVRIVISSFFIAIVVVYFLPFSAFYWSERDQINRLKTIAESYAIIQDGKYINATDGVFTNFYTQIEYLNAYHTLKNAKADFSQELIDKLKINEFGYGKSIYYSSYNQDNKEETLEIVSYYNNSDIDFIKIPKGYTKFRTVSFTSYDTLYDYEISTELQNLMAERIDLKSGKFSVASEEVYDKNAYLQKGQYFTRNQEDLYIEYEGKLYFVYTLMVWEKDGVIIKVDSASAYEFAN